MRCHILNKFNTNSTLLQVTQLIAIFTGQIKFKFSGKKRGNDQLPSVEYRPPIRQ